jgi:histidinol dehydrogenase
VIHFGPRDLRRVADDVRAMARVEGLTAHQATVDVRLAKGETR